MHYRNVQGLRAIASLMVLVSHVLHPFTPMQAHWITPYIYNFGPGGVDIFFVISGFIIYTVGVKSGADRTKSRLQSTLDFLLRRLIRIYPIYWVMFLFASLTIAYIVDIPFVPMPVPPTSSLLLLLSASNNIILAAWSLHYEMIYYMVATLSLLIFRQHLLVGLMIWFAFTLACILVAFAWGKDWMHHVWASSLFFEFMFGVFVALLIGMGQTAFAKTSFVVGVVLYALGSVVLHRHGGWWALAPWWRTACWGIPTGFILYGLITIELRGLWTFPKVWQYLGNASYSIYLSHQTFFAILALIVLRAGLMDLRPRLLVAGVACVLAIAFGAAIYQFIEKWLLDKIGNAVLGKRVPVSTIQPAE
ncbi:MULTISPECIES: acyltransferase [unclassified Mesorhizobium]|uniref:acyltransferase family protein n=1 Tax=unclassified Mesorhizobium TaxID=325217 RepID=UPI000BAFEB11|nr:MULTISPECIES: acyltransferase [unclassified Mesorhizobium]PBB28641.1 exopolysaccharide production protein exoz [Mesorhizobium sp. WSM4304]PBB73324.1 exopolysaccharide production protein exoz [Mesorhizobium sp. WSM4308]